LGSDRRLGPHVAALGLFERLRLRLELGLREGDAVGRRWFHGLASSTKRWLEQTRRSAPDALDPVRGRSGSGLVGGGEAIVLVLWLRAGANDTDDRAPEARDLPD
jgi:hypothetical protein